MIKALAFDVFGTVFDLSLVDREEVSAYVDHVRRPEWSPLELPEHWNHLPAHPDAVAGIERLRTKYIVVTLSNGPLRLLVELSRRNQITWDAIIPIEMAKVYKPHIGAYRAALEVLGMEADEVGMVTANPTFGDLEAAKALGMEPILIRNEGCPSTIIELALSLGCYQTEPMP